jgi:murein DD-endopeptidase MepM/ murein hydrolase activator NlpD
VRGWITSEYGERTSPYTGEVGSVHQGVDIANKLGSPIVAAADGMVLYAAWTPGGYGKMVEIAHGYGYTTRYGHCSRLRVSPGQRVRRGEIIAYLGATGNATGPHVHYEIRLYGVPVSPRPFMR